MVPDILPQKRAMAKEMGESHYFTGKECLRGHVAKRNTTSGKCSECDKTYSAKFRKENPEYSSVFNKSYYKKNKEKIKKDVAIYYSENRTHLIEMKKRHYLENKEKYNELSRKDSLLNKERYRRLSRSYYLSNKEEIADARRKYRQDNRDDINRRVNKIKIKRREAIGNFSSDDVIHILNLQDGKCVYCKCSLEEVITIDHKIPLSRGGSNWPDNIQFLCFSCNSRKGTRTHDEWLECLVAEQGPVPLRRKHRLSSVTGKTTTTKENEQ